MKAKKFTVEVTEKQLADIIVCLSHCADRGLGYGFVPEYQHGRPEWRRLQLQAKLEKILPPKEESTPFLLGSENHPVAPEEMRKHRSHYREANYGK